MDFCSLFLTFNSLTFTLISYFAFCYVGFTSFSNRPIVKLKKGVGQSKPPATKPKQSTLAIVKDNSFKPRRRPHIIAPKLEFSNTQDDLIEIETVKEEVSVQRDEIIFTEDESKNQDSPTAFEGGHSSNDLSKSKDGHFVADQGSIGKNSSSPFTFSSSGEHFTFPLLPFYQFSGSLPLSFLGLSLV